MLNESSILVIAVDVRHEDDNVVEVHPKIIVSTDESANAIDNEVRKRADEDLGFDVVQSSVGVPRVKGKDVGALLCPPTEREEENGVNERQEIVSIVDH